MSVDFGVQKVRKGEYLYKGWQIRQLTKFRWRGTKLGESITRSTMSEVCDFIRGRETYREEQERKSI